MSREERRAYQRQMKSFEKGPALPPAARARAERTAARRQARRSTAAPSGPLSRRFLIRAVLVAIAIGFLGFSVQWGEGMPWALYVGLAVGVTALVVIVGVRFLLARVSSAT
jgi:F0F1-type ATP synthase assembly protein I